MMIENKNWIGVGIISLILILSGIGYTITNDTYYCPERGIVMDCLRFSESENRCYPSLTTTKGYRDCDNWTKVNDYIEINNTVIDELTNTNPGTTVFKCDRNKCIEVKNG